MKHRGSPLHSACWACRRRPVGLGATRGNSIYLAAATINHPYDELSSSFVSDGEQKFRCAPIGGGRRLAAERSGRKPPDAIVATYKFRAADDLFLPPVSRPEHPGSALVRKAK